MQLVSSGDRKKIIGVAVIRTQAAEYEAHTQPLCYAASILRFDSITPSVENPRPEMRFFFLPPVNFMNLDINQKLLKWLSIKGLRCEAQKSDAWRKGKEIGSEGR